LLRAAASAPLLALPKFAFALPASVSSPTSVSSEGRELHFSHAHTGENLSVVYWENGSYLPDALSEINFLMRDFRSEEVFPIDPQLLDLAHRIQTVAGDGNTFTIFSAYRSPATNRKLRESSSGVAKKSFHMQGKALDIQLSGVSADKLRDIAVSLNIGGVGFYSSSGFVHVDVGPVRQW
jgi:uncharacterized protein YcbK (DUF882 family)